MKHVILAAALCAAPFAATPVAAQEEGGLSLMERGAQLFFKGLMTEIEPAIEELDGVLKEIAPKLEELALAMGPRLQQMLDQVDDWAYYEMPEIQPNGDIIIRRKPSAPPLETAPEGIEL